MSSLSMTFPSKTSWWRPFAALAALVLAGGTAFAQGMPPAPVEVAPVVRRDIAPRRTFVGSVRPLRRAVVGAEIAGRVEDVLARDGDHVARGAPIATLRTTGIQLDVRVARAELALRQSELDELENGSRPEEILQAEARLAAAEAELAHAQWDRETGLRLRETGGLSEGEERRLAVTLAAAEQALRREQALLDLVRAGPRRERLTQAQARVATQEAVIARLEEDLARHSIKAPFDGVIVREHTEAGEWLSVGAAVVELMALGEVDVRVGVVEDHVGSLRVGAEATIEVGAFPNRAFTGRVHAVVPEGDERTRSFPVDVRVANEATGAGDHPLKPGMFARVSLAVGAPVSSLVVPKDALVLAGPSAMVYVIVPADPATEGASATVRPVPVRTGAADGGLVAVEAELKEGELVVTRGNERLRPGQDVVVASAGDREGGR